MAPPPSPRVSVVIPVYNDSERLALCLDAIAGQTYPLEEVEVLVVDNGSETPPVDVVERHGFCRMLHEAKPGSYAARNRALSETRGEVLAFTDSDCLPESDWLENGVARLDAGDGAIAIGGAIEVFPVNDRSPSAVELYDIAHGLRQDAFVEVAHFAATANLITSRRVMDDVGPFNEQLKSSGDAEWGGRAHAAGWPLVYAEEVRIRHPARRSLKAIVTKTRRHAGGRIDHLGTRADRLSVWRYAKSLFGVFFPHIRPIFEGRQRLAQRGYGIGSWIKASWVLLVLQYTKAFEMIRVRLGGQSVRN